MVAKSFQSYPCGTPYEKGNKMYVLITKPNGTQKEVRWYSEVEYKKLYPADTYVSVADIREKARFGFDRGDILIPVGQVAENSDWLKSSHARWATWFGWYFIPGEEQLEVKPESLTYIPVSWDMVSKDGYTLKPTAEVQKIIRSLGGQPEII